MEAEVTAGAKSHRRYKNSTNTQLDRRTNPDRQCRVGGFRWSSPAACPDPLPRRFSGAHRCCASKPARGQSAALPSLGTGRVLRAPGPSFRRACLPPGLLPARQSRSLGAFPLLGAAWLSLPSLFWLLLRLSCCGFAAAGRFRGREGGRESLLPGLKAPGLAVSWHCLLDDCCSLHTGLLVCPAGLVPLASPHEKQGSSWSLCSFTPWCGSSCTIPA